MNKEEKLERKRIILKYKFEFARRNSGYIKDYYILARKCEQNLAGSDEIFAFSKKWKIFPANPQSTLQDLFKQHENFKPKRKFHFENLSISTRIFSLLRSEMDFQDKKALTIIKDVKGFSKIKGKLSKQENYLLLLINLSMPKGVVLGQLNSLLAKLYKNRRFYIDRYDDWLRVYDLKPKNRMDFEKIANKDEAGGIRYAIHKVKRDYERCKKMIYGGYKRLR